MDDRDHSKPWLLGLPSQCRDEPFCSSACACVRVCVLGLRARGWMERGAQGCYGWGQKEPACLQPVYQYLVDGLSSPSPPFFFYKRQRKKNEKLN